MGRLAEGGVRVVAELRKDVSAPRAEHDADRRPMFSFLTLAYRTEDTLARTLDAALAQTRPDWEMVVVDNGGSDAIAAIVEPYLADPRFRLVRHENRGLTGGIQSASDAATGRYLVVLNSDDSVTPDFCARTGQLLESDPGIAAVTCDAHLFVDPGEIRLPRSFLATGGARGRPDGSRPLRLAEVIDGPSLYYCGPIRRDAWDAVGGMPMTDAPLVNDLDFWLRTVSAGYDVRMIPDKLGLYRIRAGSESHPVDPASSELLEQQRERVLVRAAGRSTDPADGVALERSLRRLRYYQSIRRARLAMQTGSVDEARRWCALAFDQRRTPRSTALLVGLRVAPSVLLHLHPGKQALQQWAQRRAAQLLRHPSSRQGQSARWRAS